MNRLAETNVWPNVSGRCLTARAGRASPRAMLRCLGYSATIAIASCAQPTPQERAKQSAALALQAAQRAYDDTYDHCLYRVTGPFAGASIDVMHECARQASAASGLAQ